jgi:asparagine synthase (glutamine-hydrolysing)
MVGAIRHEAFYNHGLYLGPKMFTHVGWTCHKRSFTDCMPIFNEKCDIILFLAGEVFPDPNQIFELRRKGHEFSEGDASYLVHLYEELGDKFFGDLNGCFSGFLIDRRQGKSFLFNDRFGMHRVFIHHGKDGFFFSSEAKALLAVLPETREFDPKGLCELLTCGCTLGERSLFKGIEVLPGASLLEFANGRLLRKTQYFDRTVWEGQTRLSETEFISRFTEMLPRVTRKYISSQEPVGMSLTGGLDSRMILACLDIPQGGLPYYTFGSMYRDTFDVKISRRVAKECGQTHQVLVLGDDFLKELPKHLEKAVFLSDGYLGLSGAAELYANSLAREIASVRLTGNWGSELLRGVRAFKFAAPGSDILHPDLHEFVEEARNTFNRMNGMNRISFVPFQQAPHQSYGRLSIERSQVTPRTPFLDNEVVGLCYQAPETCNGFALAEAIISHCRPDLLTIPTDRGFLGLDGALIRAGRRVYREALFKAEYLISHGAPDWVVRRSNLLRLLRLEKKLLGRHKFYHFRQWLREDLAEYVRETLFGYRSSGIKTYFAPERLEQNVKDHLNGRRNCTEEIDMMLTVALTFNLFVAAGTEEIRS